MSETIWTHLIFVKECIDGRISVEIVNVILNDLLIILLGRESFETNTERCTIFVSYNNV